MKEEEDGEERGGEEQGGGGRQGKEGSERRGDRGEKGRMKEWRGMRKGEEEWPRNQGRYQMSKATNTQPHER